jgi:CheY-like chemotaxis protein
MTRLTRPLKFLIVDDSRAIQAIIRRALLQCGYEPVEIQTAANGVQGLDALKTFTPDLVITDWHMPQMSGLEMVQTMRQLGHQSLRVGFVTTERTESLLNQAVRNGAMFIVHKPFDDTELISVVSAAVKDIAEEMRDQEAKAVGDTPSVAETPQPVPEGVVVLPASLTTVLGKTLGKIPFRLIANDQMTVERLTPNLLLGLYGVTNRKGVHAIGLMDSNAVCMIGGGALRKLPTEVRAGMAEATPPEQLITPAHLFLTECARCLAETSSAGDASVSLAKASIVKNSFSKLQDVLKQTTLRSDFRISIPGYGEGRLAFFVMDGA